MIYCCSIVGVVKDTKTDCVKLVRRLAREEDGLVGQCMLEEFAVAVHVYKQKRLCIRLLLIHACVYGSCLRMYCNPLRMDDMIYYAIRSIYIVSY